jgi:DNA-binding CsgD family transcriptional regulator
MHQNCDNIFRYNFELFEKINDPIFVADKNRQIHYCNRSFKNICLPDHPEKQVRFFKHYIQDEGCESATFVGIVHELGQSTLDLSMLLWNKAGANTNKPPTLSCKELQILHLVALGHTCKEIARILGNSVHTIAFHQKSIHLKLGVRSKVEAINAGKKFGLLHDQFPLHKPTQSKNLSHSTEHLLADSIEMSITAQAL